MARAPRQDQLQLLQVADIDAHLARLKIHNERHPLRAEVGAQMNLVAAKARELTEAKKTLSEAEKTLEAASARTKELATVIAAKHKRLNEGVGMDSRELLTLQSEIVTNQARLDQANDAEFLALEAVEEAQESIAAIEAEQRLINERIVAGRAELEEEIERLEREAEDLRRERNTLYSPLADELKNAYERAQHTGGLTVIALHHNGQTSGGVQLSPIEVNQIKNADPEQIHISDDYQCIVVLLDS
ncbi:zinc ribbon domain-containing protein [Trueperella pecoris]|uniref:CT398-like coiled coil hairpin domain-containing protein n=1 Tax=Trueperella pecoris TaxID=2733571 RepID=A0A7M1QZ07_9ACTO|nr:hypothetical protein [Trueperella pecoris]QOR46417.1 hypothetical protein INS88_04250 [Trueperella pecoris]